MMRYDYTISHVPGKELIVADTLSRAPIDSYEESDQELIQEADTHVQAIITSLPVAKTWKEDIQQQQQQDEICQSVALYCQTCWPERKHLAGELRL